MKEISLTQGRIALVDDELFEQLNAFKWHVARNKKSAILYARRFEGPASNRKAVLMHRQILRLTDRKAHCDHKNGDGLDNQRHNLRAVSHRQNHQNTRTNTNNTSGFKGVTLHKPAGKWQARICIEGKETHLGLFDDPRMAALTYDEAAREHFGEFARTNGAMGNFWRDEAK